MTCSFPDFQPSGNQATDAALYEIENEAFDPAGLVLDTMRGLGSWKEKVLVDLGCGSGYWLPGYCNEAAEVIGVEPDPDLLALATSRGCSAKVVAGSAEHLPLDDSSVDVVHARFAYFFPPGCGAGLAEVRRVLRPGGRLVVVDNDHRHGEFATLLARSEWASAQGRSDTTDKWWAAQGADRVEVLSEWLFSTRGEFEAVLGLEFPPDVVRRWLNDHPAAVGLSYGYVLFAVKAD